MTWFSRAFAGFLVGALLTLVAHPVSRPFLLSAAEHVSVPRIEGCFDDRVAQPAPPQDLEGASLWLQLAAERTVKRQTLSSAEVRTLLGIARRAATVDSQNAFWHQEEAVYLSASGHPKEAYAAWERASHCQKWDDFQLRRLLKARNRLASLVGAKEAWQLAYVYSERSDASVSEIERYGHTLLSTVGLESSADLKVRYVTLLNGELIRNHARSVATGILGANLVELSAYPSDLVHPPSKPGSGSMHVKRLWVAQSKFLNQLDSLDVRDAALRARKAFANNDSWKAFALAQDPHELLDGLTAASLLSCSVIGACAFAACVGVFIYVLGLQISGRVAPGGRLSPYFVVSFAAALAVLSTWFTHDLWAGLVGALSGAFLYAGPANVRKARPEDLGPLFAFLLTLIAGLCGAALGAYAIFKTSAAEALLPTLGVPANFYRTPLMLGMACIFFSLALTAVPIWAMVQRLGTPHVFGLALRKFGAYLGFGSLAVGILLGPIAVYADGRISQSLQHLVENEPLYYIDLYA